MTTGIRGLNNESSRPVTVVNKENRSNSWTCKANEFDSRVYAWIPQGEERGIDITTCRNGGTTCNIWDSNWKIYGRWNDESYDFVLYDGVDNGQDFKLTVYETGIIGLS